MYPRGEKRFLLINYITIVALFVLIMAGGIVRGSGSGMGCPDWPKCFGSYIPPTDVSQLPVGYETKYVEQRVEKNLRFAKSLDILGYGELADRIREDKSVLMPEEFNVSKTWTEYINRLIGALTGFFLLGCAVYSFVYLKLRKRIFFLSIINVVLVGFQAWLGSIVVSTNLLAWVVTVHMLLALVIVGISIYTYFHARILREGQLLRGNTSGIVKAIAVVSLVVMIIQIAIGTEVREQIDAVASSMNNLDRSEWVSKVGSDFNLHRDMAIFVFVAAVVLFFLIRRNSVNRYQERYIGYVLILLVLQIVTGVILAYFALPAIAQPIHISLACLMFGAQFYLVLLMQRNNFTIAR